jgi:hypothetical protein
MRQAIEMIEGLWPVQVSYECLEFLLKVLRMSIVTTSQL